MNAPKGNRKQRTTFFTLGVLLIGFIFAVWMKADNSLFTTFAAAVVGASGAFMWGNAQEHKNATPEVKP